MLGGDVSGGIYILNTEGTDNGADIACELYTNAWNPYIQEGAEARLLYLDIYADVEKNTQITVEFYKDSDVSPYLSKTVDLLPPLGFITDVANITQASPAQVTASQHGLADGDVIYIYGVKGMLEIDGGYTITVVDENNFTLDSTNSTAFTAYTTGGKVVKRKFYRAKSWKRTKAGGVGFQHRVKITSTGSNTPLKIDAFKPQFEKVGERVIN